MKTLPTLLPPAYTHPRPAPRRAARRIPAIHKDVGPLGQHRARDVHQREVGDGHAGGGCLARCAVGLVDGDAVFGDVDEVDVLVGYS